MVYILVRLRGRLLKEGRGLRTYFFRRTLEVLYCTILYCTASTICTVYSNILQIGDQDQMRRIWSPFPFDPLTTDHLCHQATASHSVNVNWTVALLSSLFVLETSEAASYERLKVSVSFLSKQQESHICTGTGSSAYFPFFFTVRSINSTAFLLGPHAGPVRHVMS